MNYRRIRSLLAFSFVVAGSACSAEPGVESVGTDQAAILGVDTHLYLLCSATSWDANDRSRLVETTPGNGHFSLSYEVTQDWMVSGADGCSIVETNQKNGWGTQQQRYAFRAGQSTLVVVPDARALTPAQSSFFQVRYPAKGRFIANVNWHNGTFTLGAAASVLPQRSLFERNDAALTRFTVAETLARIAQNGNVSGGTAWHDAIFKTTARKASFPPTDPGPFCDSAGFPGRVNDFIVGCAGNMSHLVGHLDKWEGLSVANRFDLAPSGGENCGEARASFYVPPGRITLPQRSFLIFEALLPNPRPDLGLDGCRPVQNFWVSLSNLADPAARGEKLAQAFLTGEPSLTAAGFKPFFTFENFGPGKGRVRSETLGPVGVVPLWDFREFRILAGGGAVMMPVAQSFSITTFAATDHAKSAPCRADLVNTLGALIPASANPNFVGLDVAPPCFDGASGNFGTRPEDIIAVGAQPELTAALQARISQLAPNANLTPLQIAARLSFAGTCIGCHHRPNSPQFRDLGQGLTLPVVTPAAGESLDDIDFTQVNNLREEPCAASGPDAAQSCFKLSPVLGAIFLPHRKSVLETYLNTPVGSFRPPAPGQTSARTIGGAPNSRTH
jgi:hypothetical protein